MGEVQYTLVALHEDSLEPIVWVDVAEPQAEEIVAALWPDENFWTAPGGSGVVIASDREARTISRVLGGCGIGFDPSRHRWIFQVSLAWAGEHAPNSDAGDGSL